MVTKYVKADEPTQVNSNLIGVKVVHNESAGVPANCTVSYSVDGETWTDVPTALEEDNNVIGNIPRYVYLLFSQDVVITVE